MSWRRFIGEPQCCDCLELMGQLPDGCIDLVVTDPPYIKECLYLYRYLADECPRIMKQGASLTAIVGHYAIPEVTAMFNDKLKYRWIICMNQFNGSHPRMAMGIEVMWKPILWYVNGSYPAGRGFIKDGFKVEGMQGQTKKIHKWQQDESWAEYLITKLSQPGDLVVDFFAGSFTTAVVAERLGRQWICCDINPEYVELGRKRLEAERTQSRQLELA